MDNPTEGRLNPVSDANFPAIDPASAGRIFTGLSHPGFDPTDEFKTNLRTLGQIYDMINRHLTGQTRKSESYYPTWSDVYEDLQHFKRSISDKSPMPTDDEFTKLLVILAIQTPPFIYIVREVTLDTKGSLEFISKFAAPTEKHIDKVPVAFRSVLRNTLIILKENLYSKQLHPDIEELNRGIRNAEDLHVKNGRVDSFLNHLYLRLKSLEGSTDLARVNESIKTRIYRPLLQGLVRDKSILIFSCDDLRGAGKGERISDVIVFNVPEELQKRFKALLNLLDSPLLENFLDKGALQRLRDKRISGELSTELFAQHLASHALDHLAGNHQVPNHLRDLAAEVLKLSQWLTSHQREEKESAEAKDLKAIFEKIKGANGLFRAKQGHKYLIDAKYLKSFVAGRAPNLIACTYPFDEFTGDANAINLDPYDSVYVLPKDRVLVGKAVDTAVDLFRKNDDVFLLRILEFMLGLGQAGETEARKIVPPIYYEKLMRAVRESYVRYFPWHKRILYYILGGEIPDKTIKKLRPLARRDSNAILERIKGRKLEKEQKEARKQVKARAKDLFRGKEADAEALTENEINVIAEITTYLDDAWGNWRFPTLNDLRGMPLEKEAFRQVMGFVDVGAASVRAIVRIPTKGDPIYGHLEYLKNNKEMILAKCDQKMREADQVLIDPEKVISLRTAQAGKEIYSAIDDYVRWKI